MLSYTPPLNDIRFVLNHVLDAPATLRALPAHAEVDSALMEHVIEEAGRFAADILFPLNATGDTEGCRLENGAVSTPAGFADAYRQFCAAGWPALACDPAHGGQGLPNLLDCILYEMLSATNHGWTMYPGLLHGAYACLSQHASDTLKARYLPKIVSGEWLATMGLTEAHAGSDLGLLRTKAVPQDDGSYCISGSKIFISGGEQDLTENIVHLVLARLPDAPAGTKGVSLFLVPKFLPDETDSDRPGARNAVHCTGIEHKMGIHGSATCSLQFDDAVGWMIGEPNRGLAAMFVMMNAARLHVGVQALGLAETALQNAAAYAQERLQLKAVNRPASRQGEAADPIAMHPAVQRLLMTQRASVEGSRMLAYWTALMLDGAEHHPDADVRDTMHKQVSLITPVVKALLTEQGFQGASQALQIFGGHGYICETGIEQYMRDARITMIYEGTNEIQAVDLVIRKVLADGGAQLNALLAQIDQSAREAQTAVLQRPAAAVLELTQRLRLLTAALAHRFATEPEPAYRIAPEMLRLVGHAALSWLWLRAASAAIQTRAENTAFCDLKLETAQYYFGYVMPETQQLFGVIDECLHAGAQAAAEVR